MNDKTDKGKENQRLSVEELRLLKDVMGDVQAYDGKDIVVPEQKMPENAPKTMKVEPQLKKPEERAVNTDGVGLDKRTDERLRRGQMPIDATLDLHHMNQNEAEEALERFVLEAYERGQRCLLVITGKGKGKRSEEDWLAQEPGVLKRRTPEWLARDPLKPLVLKHYPARPKDGGEGALYVLLRRKRD